MAIALDNFIAINSVNAVGVAVNTTTPGFTNDSQIEGANAGNFTVGKATFGTPSGAGFTIASGTQTTLTQNENHIYMWVNSLVWSKASKACQLFGNAANTQNTTIAGGDIIRFTDTISAVSTGANMKEFFVSGSDKDQYGGWKCYVVDPIAIPNLTTASSPFNGMLPPGRTVGIGGTSLAVIGSIKVLNTLLQTVTGIANIHDAAKIVSGYSITTGIEDLSTLYALDSINNALNTIVGDGYPVGVLTQNAGIYYQVGKITVGSGTTVQYTELSDTNQTIAFPEMLIRSSFNRYVANGGGTTGTGNSTTVAVVKFGDWNGSEYSNGCVLKGGGYFYTPYTATSGTNTITVTFATAGIAGKLRVGMRVFGPYITPNNYIIAIPGSQTIQLSSVVATAATSYLYFYSPLYGVWSAWANNNSSSQFKLYSSTASEVLRMYLSSVSELRGNSISNFGGIITNSAIVSDCTFSLVQPRVPMFGQFGLNVTRTGLNSLSNLTFTDCISDIKITDVAGSSASKSMTGFSFNEAVAYIYGTFTSGSNQITSTSSTAGITIGDPVRHAYATTNISLAGVTLTANATASASDTYSDLSAVLFTVGTNPIMAGMEVVAGTYGTAVVPANTFVKRLLSNNVIELTNRITGTTATGQTLVFKRGVSFVTGVVGSTIFMSQNANTTGTVRIPIGHFALENDIEANVPTNGSNTTVNSTYNLYTGSTLRVSQSFPGNNEKLSSVSFRIARVGSPTGTLKAILYQHSGTYGTSSVPGSAQLTSDSNVIESYTVDVATLGTTAEYINFQFAYLTTNDYTIATGTNYVVTLEFTSTSSTIANYVAVSYNSSSVVTGNAATYNGSWTAAAASDLGFTVYTNGNILLTNSSPAWPILSSRGGGISLIGTAINIVITILKPDGTPLSGARVNVLDSSTHLPITGDFPANTDVLGEVSSSLVYTSDTDLIIRVRSSPSGGARYEPIETTGILTINGYSTTIKMTLDPIAT